jgi:hypothetical protein
VQETLRAIYSPVLQVEHDTRRCKKLLESPAPGEPSAASELDLERGFLVFSTFTTEDIAQVGITGICFLIPLSNILALFYRLAAPEQQA